MGTVRDERDASSGVPRLILASLFSTLLKHASVLSLFHSWEARLPDQSKPRPSIHGEWNVWAAFSLELYITLAGVFQRRVFGAHEFLESLGNYRHAFNGNRLRV